MKPVPMTSTSDNARYVYAGGVLLYLLEKAA